MTTNIPYNVPGVIFDASVEIQDGFGKKSIKPEHVRNDALASEALQNG